MGDFKDKHGHSRLAAIWDDVKSVAPDIVEAVGDLTGVGALERAGEMLGQKKKELKEDDYERLLRKIEYAKGMQDNITKRHKNDMSSDSWLSKNIRPLSVAFLLIYVAITAFLDANSKDFTMPEGYMSLFTQLMLSAFGFYFVGREVQKGIINFRKK